MNKKQVLLFVFALIAGINAQAADVQNYITLQLAQDAINRDETVIYFRDNTSVAYEQNNDVSYLPGNGQVSLASLSSDNKPLTLNMMPFSPNATAIGLNVSTKANGIFKLIMKEVIGIPQVFDIWLMDRMTHDSLDMRHNDTYILNINKSDTNSFGAKRFQLIIRPNAGYTYRLLGFWAQQLSGNFQINGVKGINITWKAENENVYTGYTLERSTDNGKTYTAIDSIPADRSAMYRAMDNDPSEGVNLYRLKQAGIAKSITYSKPVQVLYSRQGEGLISAFTQKKPNLYPNPAIDVINIMVDLKTDKAEPCDISVSNMYGAVLKQVVTAQHSWQFQVSDLLPGVYIVRIVKSSDKSLVAYDRFSKR